MQVDKMAELLRRVRHDFANHLQVVNGYLEIGQADRARQYLGTVISAMGAERVVFAAHNGAAALYFYEQLLKVRDLGINLHYEDLDVEAWEILRACGEPLHSMGALRQTMQGDLEDPIVYLSIYEDREGIDMFFSWAGWEQSPPAIRVNKE